MMKRVDEEGGDDKKKSKKLFQTPLVSAANRKRNQEKVMKICQQVINKLSTME